MKINWKARFKSKAFIISFVLLIISFIYQMLRLFDVIPAIDQDNVVNIVTILIDVAAMLGVINDPTTPGLSDSARALTYYTDNDIRNAE